MEFILETSGKHQWWPYRPGDSFMCDQSYTTVMIPRQAV